MQSTLNLLKARYVALSQLAVNAGLYAGKQNQDYHHQEQSLWAWAATILGYDLEADEPRHFWREAFAQGYANGARTRALATAETPPQ